MRSTPETTANNLYSLIAFTDKEPKDWMVPSRWGTVCNRPYRVQTETNILPDRQARRPVRPTAIHRLLHRHVKTASGGDMRLQRRLRDFDLLMRVSYLSWSIIPQSSFLGFH